MKNWYHHLTSGKYIRDMSKFLLFLKDPFGRKRIGELEEKIEAITKTKPLYDPSTLYMEALATEFARSLPAIDGVHPDARMLERIEAGFKAARAWMNQLDRGQKNA